MFVSECLNVNEKNHLTIGQADTVELAAKYGTPLYVMDEGEIRKNCRIYKNAVDTYYDGKGLILYASKAFSCKEIYRIVAQEGLGVDVVSGGEMYTAYKAGFPMHKVYFHGNNKTEAELKLALDLGVGHIVADNAEELERLDALCAQCGKTVDVLVRIKPGIDAHTHDFVKTGQIDSKFGVALENGEAMAFFEKTLTKKHIRMVGIHCHIGSQIFDLSPFEEAGAVMMQFMADLRDRFGIELTKLNLGGGFGIKYVEGDNPVAYDAYICAVSKVIKQKAEELKLSVPEILMEPGRSLVAPAGITLYTVGNVKDIPDVRTYVSIDGGMGDNPRYILYGAEYTALVANKAGDKPDMKITLAGKCCESGDLIGENMDIQHVETGDIVAVLATGAYNYSMSSNYNRIPRPAVVMVHDGESRVVVRAETYEDVIRNDI